QSKQKMQIDVTYLEKDRTLGDLINEPSPDAEKVSIETYWNGDKAPEGRTFTARLFWSDAFLYVLFEARQAEPLVISDSAVLGEKAMNLWDRDVCEIFVAPNAKEPDKYFEFEI